MVGVRLHVIFQKNASIRIGPELALLSAAKKKGLDGTPHGPYESTIRSVALDATHLIRLAKCHVVCRAR
jgi:hypothetical protein